MHANLHDSPDPSEILAAAAAFLRSELLPALAPELAFKTRVLANALDLVARQVAQPLPHDDPADLARRIESGEIPLTDPTLLDHLWTTTLAKLAVDQPAYASYRAELPE